MRKSLASALAAVLVLGAAGCALSPVRLSSGMGLPPQAVPAQDLSGAVPTFPDEPEVCFFSMIGGEGDFVPRFRDDGGFRAFRALTTENLSPRGCGVLVSLRQTGATVLGTSFVDFYSPYSTDPVQSAQAEGKAGPVLGFETIARYLKRGLQPGQPLREKLDALRRSGAPRLDARAVAALAGDGLMTADSLSKDISLYYKGPPLEVVAAAAPEPEAPAAASLSAAPAPSRPAAPRTDLDDLPPARPEDAHAYAVVIGIEHYRERLPNADYAAADARLTAKYFERVLGVPAENLALLTNDRATKGDFEKYFERWLPNRVQAGDKVYVYYSGHGAPNPAKGDAYLVPYDGDPTYIGSTGFAVSRLFEDLGRLPAKSVFVAMDSCFSGAGGRSVLARGARPLVSVVQGGVPPRLTVLSASAADQISNTDEAAGHGLFTYYFLEGLKKDGPRLHAAYDYLKPKVERYARLQYNSDQVPQWRQGR
ncbi:MAG: caspase family protein [Elusimicrobia bacterium]|nr:caspase family protein [Elusimicrobiota bacterium]